ncbi:unnamed protein product [Microthlaspi erraticum]|uniref:Reverse transcriptase zinc-binding domain-containing protein n=1 Tax=Microthlaspi erraticum TaxID=1685480 RepID=A0A6D2J9B6_9BRAS|nr:unnamed protein product [Microthlaspi erraticum]
MQPLLENLISKHQSAFVPGRAIMDNVLITYETLHYLKLSKAAKRCSMAVKTDMSKAYDRIEWGFLKKVLQKLEVLSGLCKQAQASGKLKGLQVARRSPFINHLLFADDSMFFCKTNEANCLTLNTILSRYEQSSGQCINLNKSTVTFSAKTPPEVKARVKLSLGITKEGGVGKYLGVLENFGRRKRDVFTVLVDKIRQRSHSWTTRFLSRAGKKILLKSVLLALPTYTMSCFKIPLSLCNRIQSILTRFWWDSSPDKRKISWIAWKKLTKPKGEGGLGFREVETFNDALLAKLSWRILKNSDSLLAQVLIGKYCSDCSFMESKAKPTSSHGWRSIIAGMEVLKQGEYTTKSGYLLLSSQSSPYRASDFNWYKNIWNVPTAPKIKHFLWRAANQALPVGNLLAYRGITTDLHCKRCGGLESISHILLDCTFARSVWNLAPLLTGPASIPTTTNIKQILTEAHKSINLPPTGISSTPIYSWILWNLWTTRNQAIFENKIFSEAETLLKALRDAKSWDSANLTIEKSPKSPRFPTDRPRDATFLCNVDGAWIQSTQGGGMG